MYKILFCTFIFLCCGCNYSIPPGSPFKAGDIVNINHKVIIESASPEKGVYWVSWIDKQGNFRRAKFHQSSLILCRDIE